MNIGAYVLSNETNAASLCTRVLLQAWTPSERRASVGDEEAQPSVPRRSTMAGVCGAAVG